MIVLKMKNLLWLKDHMQGGPFDTKHMNAGARLEEDFNINSTPFNIHAPLAMCTGKARGSSRLQGTPVLAR